MTPAEPHAGATATSTPIDPELYALALRFNSHELNEHQYIFELGRLYEHSDYRTRELIKAVAKGPHLPAARYPANSGSSSI